MTFGERTYFRCQFRDPALLDLTQHTSPTSTVHNRFPMRTLRIQSERRQTIPQVEIKNHGFLTTVLGGLLLFVAMAAPTLAVDSVWDTIASSNSWNEGGNWNTGIAPVNAGDTATFNTFNITSLNLGDDTIDSMTFNPGASAFVIRTSFKSSVSFVGAGIVNNSGVTQTIVNFDGGTTSFLNSSTAGNATLIALGAVPSVLRGGSISFFDTSTAGNATLTAGGSSGNDDESIGTISFHGTSNAGNATLTAEAGDYVNHVVGKGGSISFFDTSTAGNATLIANGGADLPLPTRIGSAVISFSGNSTAGNATLIANDGLGSGPGGTILFGDQSTGGTARVEVFGNGKLDISSHVAPTVTVGSIEGNGAIFVGANNLTVGSNNLSTLFSGQISDDGEDGSLTKVGTGTLTLMGLNNVATRNTTVNGGSLIVDGSLSTTQILVNAGGLFGGNGSLVGNVLNRGIVSPGNSPGTLTVTGNYTQTAGGTLRLEVAGLGATAHDLLAINGIANLSGTLQVIRLNNFRLSPGGEITLLTANAGVSGTFTTVQNDFGTIAGIQIVYLPDSVLLEATQGSFKEF